MAISFHRNTVAEVVRQTLSGNDHRDIVVAIIDSEFMNDALNFFECVAYAKMRSAPITLEWYRDNFMSTDLDSSEIAWNAGLNMKTITNKRGSARREIVIDEAQIHYDRFLELVDSLTDDAVGINLSLTMGATTVHLDLNETLVVINALAVRRAAIRGGTWSTMGKQVEAPLMETLCRVFSVPPSHFTRALSDDNSLREIDYYLVSPNGQRYKCEVKLMGRGNPEGADAIHARETDVFVASALSDLNKIQLDNANVLWTELQVANGFLRFQETLHSLGVPYTRLRAGADYTDRINNAVRSALQTG